ncbi:MAG: glycosyltransferase family 39 protein [Propionibacteriaceae bacterium]|nr:glycosyltransferase family 39 protein [Propionibacteriaceae bacterium]
MKTPTVQKEQLALSQRLAELEPDLYERVSQEPVAQRRKRRPSQRVKRDWVWLLPTLIGATVLHAWNMLRSPMPFDDEGTYISQAWTLATQGELSHYTYWYDHPPLGWMLLAVWNQPFKLFGIDEWTAGRIGMLAVHVVSCVLLYALVRRFAAPRWAAASAVALFTASPVMLRWGRLVLLDNIATPFLLAAWLLALDRRQRLSRFAVSAILLASAVLIKETTLLFAPAIFWSLLQSARSHRRYVAPIYVWLVTGMGLAYVVFALMKNELFDGPGHVSLEWALRWQLMSRQSSGSIFDPASDASNKVESWLETDGILLIAGAVAALLLVRWRRLRPVALLVVLLWGVVLRGGYLPGPYPISLIWPSALALVLCSARLLTLLRKWRVKRMIRAGVIGVLVVAVAGIATLGISKSQTYLTEDKVAQYRQAKQWVLTNTTPDDVVIVDNSLWFDLVTAGRPRQNIVWYQKPNTDTEVDSYLVNGWRDVDYVVLTVPLESTYRQRATTSEALDNATLVVQFDELAIYRVNH